MVVQVAIPSNMVTRANQGLGLSDHFFNRSHDRSLLWAARHHPLPPTDRRLLCLGTLLEDCLGHFWRTRFAFLALADARHIPVARITTHP